MAPEPRIRITVDGPYAVRALPVAPGRIVKTPRGEPIEWDVDEPYEADAEFLLCRCGRSKTKPFCDDSHLEGFDGTEVADRGPTADRRESYPGGGLTLTDDESLCTHAGFCRDRTSNAWDRMDRVEEPDVRAKVEAIVARCPSGRLVLLDEDGEAIEAAFVQGIVVEQDGPYWVRGGVRVESADGEGWETRNRVTLCRCGHSGNKPFCDGTHAEIGFEG
jgi:CDGSH-type Zn-finger protein